MSTPCARCATSTACTAHRGRCLRVAGLAGVVALAPVVRRRLLRWGATDTELAVGLAGDDLLPHADLTATRAITVRAAASDVWPWVAQLGQGRGGFYSYTALENALGCDIHNADRIVEEWQDVAVGDQVRLHPDVALEVAVVETGRTLVLRGAVPIGQKPPPYDFTWAFAVQDGPAGTSRLVVRERYAYDHASVALLVEPVAVVSWVMSWRMLRGIRLRAERAADAPAR